MKIGSFFFARILGLARFRIGIFFLSRNEPNRGMGTSRSLGHGRQTKQHSEFGLGNLAVGVDALVPDPEQPKTGLQPQQNNSPPEAGGSPGAKVMVSLSVRY